MQVAPVSSPPQENQASTMRDAVRSMQSPETTEKKENTEPQAPNIHNKQQ